MHWSHHLARVQWSPYMVCSGVRSMIYVADARLFQGLGNSSAVGPEMVGQLASAFLDAMYKA